VVCSSWAVGMAAGSVGEGGSKRMSQQPEFTSIPASPAPATGTAQGTVPGSVQPAAPHSGQEVSLQRHPQRIPRWLERSELFLRVLLRLYIGLAVCCAPLAHVLGSKSASSAVPHPSPVCVLRGGTGHHNGSGALESLDRVSGRGSASGRLEHARR